MARERKNSDTATRVIGTRYPRWKILLLDSIAEREGVDRAHLLARVLDRLLEEEGLLPKAMSRAA